MLGSLLLELLAALAGRFLLLVLHLVLITGLELLQLLLEFGIQLRDVNLLVMVGVPVGLGLAERGLERQLLFGLVFVVHLFVALGGEKITSSLAR